MTPNAWQASKDRQCPGDGTRLLATVPEWFGQPESNSAYVRDAATMETWTVRNEHGEVLGLTLVNHHFQHTSEIHLTLVDRNSHGVGIGTAMLQAVEANARRRGAKLLEVKTLGPSHPDPCYAKTRHFYEKHGFLPLEETDLWGAETPCLIMVKPLT